MIRKHAGEEGTSVVNDRTAHGEEFGYGGRIGTAFIDGFTFLSQPIQYIVLDGRAIFEGDIDLGPVERVEASFEMLRAELTGRPSTKAIVVTPGSQFGWPNCTIPYQIDADLPNQDRVAEAIAHWQVKTDFTFVPRTGANSNNFPDYVDFVPGSGCSAPVGRQGGPQTVTLDDGCTAGNCIHEIGHAAGLWHEQSRSDRDAFVTIIWENIIPEKVTNFTQHVSDGDDVGGYDYGSIMHYGRNAFSKNGEDTIVPTDPEAQIGQREELSVGDILAVNRVLCPTVPEVGEFPVQKAADMIRSVGLVPKITGPTNSTDPYIWRQSPPGGQNVDRGTTVTLQIRSGPVP
jgi:hypothetical protein